MKLFKEDGSGIACRQQSDQVDSSGLRADRKVQHVCASNAMSDTELVELSAVSRLQLILTGTYRQLWIKSISVFEILLADAELTPMPPRPPPIPILPPTPPASPSVACTFYVQQFAPTRRVLEKEPCGLTSQRCCEMAHEHSEANAYEMDDAGCCLLVDTVVSQLVSDAQRFGYLTTRAGTGFV